MAANRCLCRAVRSFDAVVCESFFGTQTANGVDRGLLGVGRDGHRVVRLLGVYAFPVWLPGAAEFSRSCNRWCGLCSVQLAFGVVFI